MEKQICTFYLGKYYFGLDVLEVQEVFRCQELTKAPLAPEEVSGLINLRGQIITAVNLRRRFNMEPLPAGVVPMNVVVRMQEEVVGLLVDRIGDVMEVSDELYEPAPKNIQESVRELVAGVYKLKDRMLMILDAKNVLQVNANMA